jgi:TrmH family RNA methyltransferase
VAGRLAPLTARLQAAGAAVVVVTEQVLDALSPVTQPSGIVAIAERPRPPLEDIFRRQPPLVLILCGLQDPGNVGAIIRVAEAGGATGVIATHGTADPFGWKAMRGGMGSTFRMPIAVKVSTADAVSRAKAAGLRIIATTAREGTPLPECDLGGACAVLLGSEGAGLASDFVNTADGRLSIPMRPPVESLNVAISAALVLYEASRQRATRAGLVSPGTGTNVTV